MDTHDLGTYELDMHWTRFGHALGTYDFSIVAYCPVIT